MEVGNRSGGLSVAAKGLWHAGDGEVPWHGGGARRQVASVVVTARSDGYSEQGLSVVLLAQGMAGEELPRLPICGGDRGGRRGRVSEKFVKLAAKLTNEVVRVRGERQGGAGRPL